MIRVKFPRFVGRKHGKFWMTRIISTLHTRETGERAWLAIGLGLAESMDIGVDLP